MVGSIKKKKNADKTLKSINIVRKNYKKETTTKFKLGLK